MSVNAPSVVNHPEEVVLAKGQARHQKWILVWPMEPLNFEDLSFYPGPRQWPFIPLPIMHVKDRTGN
jgi:hypothetical protein